MSRLQVGGLALIIKPHSDDCNVGKVVKLIGYIGNYDGLVDCWDVEGDLVNINGKNITIACVESHRLIPLGDKQTQDELSKELELVDAN